MHALVKPAPDPYMVVESITPDIAASYLRMNTMNRPLAKTWVSLLASSMSRGEWTLNGEPIIFATTGELLDGQYRLHAIVKSGVTVRICVIRGVNRSAFDTIDQSKRRSAGDVLSIAGTSNYNAVASAARAIQEIETGLTMRAMSIPQIRAIVERHPTIGDWASASQSKAGFRLPSAIFGLVTLGAERHGEERAAYFLEKLISGTGLSEDSPIYMLRERLLQNNMAGRRLTGPAILALSVKAWNAYIQGRKVGVLRFNKEEAFPVMR